MGHSKQEKVLRCGLRLAAITRLGGACSNEGCIQLESGEALDPLCLSIKRKDGQRCTLFGMAKYHYVIAHPEEYYLICHKCRRTNPKRNRPVRTPKKFVHTDKGVFLKLGELLIPIYQ